ncbi:hypothetical protein HAX54_028745 [Datura stramonium]|uniref:Uncharacterized protein n=1 Tax=Datura stramonium TaxID=4076 RepID=A0ABS8V524_DATST|nr:hypothetical protein [Datura stramonium]
MVAAGVRDGERKGWRGGAGGFPVKEETRMARKKIRGGDGGCLFSGVREMGGAAAFSAVVAGKRLCGFAGIDDGEGK